MMLTFRQFVSVTAATAMVGALTACGGGNEGSGEAGGSGENAAETVSLKLGHVWPENDPQAEITKQFAETVAAETDGTVEIELFPAGQIGGDRDILEGLELGTTDMWVGGAGAVNAMSELGQFFVTPFMFDSIDDAAEAYNGELGQTVRDRLSEETATTIVGFLPRGPRHITSNKALETPDGLSGMRIRVPENPMFIDSFKTLGANPTPMAFPEVFTALQQGTIDGQENPLALIKSSGFAEVQSHLNLTSHVIEPLAIAIADDVWEKLSDEQKEAMQAAAEQASTDFQEQLNQEEEQLRADLEAEGMTVVEPDIEAYREAAQDVRETTGSAFSDLYSLVD